MFLHTADGTLPPTTQLMGEVDQAHRDASDNFLYLVYSAENTFG